MGLFSTNFNTVINAALADSHSSALLCLTGASFFPRVSATAVGGTLTLESLHKQRRQGLAETTNPGEITCSLI